MPRYLLGIYQPDGPPPQSDALQGVMRRIAALHQEMASARVWVSNGPLHPPATGRIVRLSNGEPLTTDGPFVETKEHLGGFILIDVPDERAALEWGGKLARALSLDGRSSLSVEVRQMRDP